MKRFLNKRGLAKEEERAEGQKREEKEKEEKKALLLAGIWGDKNGGPGPAAWSRESGMFFFIFIYL